MPFCIITTDEYLLMPWYLVEQKQVSMPELFMQTVLFAYNYGKVTAFKALFYVGDHINTLTAALCKQVLRECLHRSNICKNLHL